MVWAVTPIVAGAQHFATLFSFDSADGSNPGGLIQATDGNFYGTTSNGGTVTSICLDGCGTIFKITPDGTLTTLHTFNGSDGADRTGWSKHGCTEYAGDGWRISLTAGI